MAQKQGGKGKQSSQSDKNYWQRIQARPGKISKTKELRAARHAARMGKTVAQLTALGGLNPSPNFPRVSQPPRPQSVIFHGDNLPRQNTGESPRLHTCNGVLIDIGFRPMTPETSHAPGLAWEYGWVNPLSGKSSLIAAQPWGVFPRAKERAKG